MEQRKIKKALSLAPLFLSLINSKPLSHLQQNKKGHPIEYPSSKSVSDHQ